MARQLATELNLPFGDWLVDALYCWLQEACEEAKIYKRAHGYHSGDSTSYPSLLGSILD